MNKNLTDHDVQLFFDAAEKLREAAERDGEKAREATAALTFFVNKINTRLNKLEADISNNINNFAENTANRAAKILSIKFEDANSAAQKATIKYQEAAKNLNLRNWLYIFILQLLLAVIFITSIIFLVPSLDEIQHRRAELSTLNSQIKGSHLQWEQCGRKKCFRTDERHNGGQPYIKREDGST